MTRFAEGQYSPDFVLRTRLFEALVERAARAASQEQGTLNGWHSAVFDTCQKIAVRDLGFTDAEFLAAVKARQSAADRVDRAGWSEAYGSEKGSAT